VRLCGLTQERTEIPISGPYGTVVWPVDPHPAPDPRYGQQYGAPRSYGSHSGCDYVVAANTPIQAIAAGTVTESKTLNGDAGNCVSINHGSFSSRYLHMIRPPSVPLGATVAVGQIIGYVGSTGSSSVNHLHIDVRISGATTDPHNFFLQYAGTSDNSKGLLMALSDAEQAEVLNTVRSLAGFLYAGGTDAAAGRFDSNSVIGRVRSLQEATFYGGPSMQDGGRSISQSLAAINTKVSSVFDATFNGGSSMKDAGKSISQSLADINGKVS
jgi:hypothetical protein